MFYLSENSWFYHQYNVVDVDSSAISDCSLCFILSHINSMLNIKLNTYEHISVVL